jgi:ubiquinone biosynthesis protein
MFANLRRFHNLSRYREIVNTLARHGFGSILEYMKVNRHLSVPSQLFRQNPSLQHSPAQHLRLALEELGPTFIKLGQMLSTRPDLLPPDFITELSKLRDSVPPTPWEEVRAVLMEELGKPPEEIFASIDHLQPLGSASLAQVYAATLRNGTTPTGEEPLPGQQVVLKVQRPNIEATIDSDLEIMDDLATLAQRTPMGEVYNPVEVVAEFAFTLRNELDYRREGHNADHFRTNFADEPKLYIPAVHWRYTTQRVLVMERIHGIKIDDLAALDAAGCNRHELAVCAARVVVKEILQDGFFHADPHPGNFMVMPGNVIGAMDFGMVGHLTDANRLDLIRLYVAAVRQDVDSLVEQLMRMCAVTGRVDRPALSRDVSRFLGKYQGASFKDIRAAEAVQEIVEIAFRHHLHMPGDLWLVSKTMGMMEGMGLQLDPDFDILGVSKPFADALVKELWSPKMWGPGMISGLEAWGHLLTDIPRVGVNLLRSLDRGEVPISMSMDMPKPLMDRVDRLITRLSLSILLAAFIVGIAMVVPIASSNNILLTMAIVGFVAVLALGVWLVISIVRNR